MAEQVWIKATCLQSEFPQLWEGQARSVGDYPLSPLVFSHSRKSVRAKAYAARREMPAALREAAQAVVDEHMKIYGAVGSFSKMGKLADALSDREET